MKSAKSTKIIKLTTKQNVLHHQENYHVIKVREFERGFLGISRTVRDTYAVFRTPEEYHYHDGDTRHVYKVVAHYQPYQNETGHYLQADSLDALAQQIVNDAPSLLKQRSAFQFMWFTVFTSDLPEYLPTSIMLESGRGRAGHGERYETLSRKETEHFNSVMGRIVDMSGKKDELLFR